MAKFTKKENDGPSKSQIFLENKENVIFEYFENNCKKGNNVFDLPVLSSKFMNISSGTIYSPVNMILLDKQMNDRRIDKIIEVYMGDEIIRNKIEKMNVENKILSINYLPSLLVKESESDMELKNALHNINDKLSEIEISPFFITFNQGKDLYDFKGISMYNIVQSFVVELKAYKKSPDDNENTQDNDIKEKSQNNNSYFKSSTKAVSLANISDLTLKNSLPKSYQSRIDKFEMPVEPGQIRTLIDVFEKISPYPVIRTVGEGSGSFFTKSGFVNIPESKYFKTPQEELHTLVHEIAHAYGFAAEQGIQEYLRFKRDSYRDYHSSDIMRGAEELVANVTAGAILASFNINANDEEKQRMYEENHNNYDKGWAKKLIKNKDEVIKAFNMVDKITKQLSFLAKQEIILRYEKDPNVLIPDFVKDEIISEIENKNLASENNDNPYEKTSDVKKRKSYTPKKK